MSLRTCGSACCDIHLPEQKNSLVYVDVGMMERLAKFVSRLAGRDLPEPGRVWPHLEA